MDGRTRTRLLSAFVAVVVLIALGLGWSKLRSRSRSSAVAASASARDATRAAHQRAPALSWRSVYLSGAEPADAPAGALGAFEGAVLSTGSGRGVAGAELGFVGPGGAHAVKSGADGRFSFLPPQEGRYELALASADGFIPFAPELGNSPIALGAHVGQGVRGITIQLVPAVKYAGLVVDPRGAPVKGAAVSVLGAGDGELGPSGMVRAFQSDERGEFSFTAPDGAILEARHPGFDPGRARLDFSAQVSHRLTIRLAEKGQGKLALAAIRGVVVDEQGTALPDVSVVARVEPKNPGDDQARLDPGGSARTDDKGEFSLAPLFASSYTLIASSPPSAPAVLRGVVAPTTAPVRLVIRRGAVLEGVVREAQSGKPVPAFTIVVSERRGPLVEETVAVRSSFDAEGRYRIEDLAAGSYSVVALARGFARSQKLAVSVSAERPTTADFSLEAGAKIAGVVRDRKTHEPLASAKASLESRLGDGDDAVPLVASAITDAGGKFEIVGISPGEHSLLIAASDHHARIVGGIVVRGSETVGPLEIELTPTRPGEAPRIELTGIGAVLSAKDDVLLIGKVLAGGGAEEAGLAPGDAVLAVDGVSVVTLGFEGALHRIRGPEGTRVVLTVRKLGQEAPTTVTVTRRAIQA